MFRTDIDFHDSVNAGHTPQVYVVITTSFGRRIYGDEALSDNFSGDRRKYDGTVGKYDGTVGTYGGADTVLSKEPRVLSYGRLQRSLSPSYKDIYAGFQTKRQARFQVKLNNADKELSKLIAVENFLTRQLDLYVGFEDTPQSKHVRLFSGVVDAMSITLEDLTLEAVER